MGCGLSSSRKTNGPFSRMELDLLELMYQDLAKRSRANKLSKDTFLTFFHLNGLWGEEIFNSFDSDKSGDVDFVQFKRGIELLVKGSYQSKIHFLFAFYDIEKKNGISYDCLLKMLYSYPKEELKVIIQDQNFLGNMNLPERQYYLGNKKELDPLREVVDDQRSSEDHQLDVRQRKYSQIIKEICSQGQIDQNNVQGSDMRPWNKAQPPVLKKRSCSMSFGNVNETCKVKMCSNITLLVKKYATFLFQELNLKKEKDLLTESQFLELIRKHQRIFTFYYESFHNYVWQVDQSNIPEFIAKTSWIDSACSMIVTKDNSSHNRFLKFFRTTLFVFRYKDDIMPIDIINMEGLYIEETKNADGYGFVIKHRDGLFPQHSYIFTTKAIQEQWLRNLGIFMKNNIYDNYVLSEKVGAGNYSVVYKGVEKKTGTTVAIKVIQKFKFSATQNSVIKQECSILELCHHPNIATLRGKFESKTTLYIVTEYMPAGDLHQYVKGNKFVEEYEAAIVLFDILQAVSYLNDLGIIHRDLKSQNIMIAKTKVNGKDCIERAKIIDFGFAVYIDNLKNLPQKERFAGTPNFVAPEILLGKEFDQRVDMFSLGVILFFMLTGQLPFDGLFADDISQKTIDCNPDFNESHWRNISDNARDLVTKLLVCRQRRIGVEQALKHPWIKERVSLKIMIGKNRRSKYI